MNDATLIAAYLEVVRGYEDAQIITPNDRLGRPLPLERIIRIEVQGSNREAWVKALRTAQEMRPKLRALGPCTLTPIRQSWHYSHGGGTCLAAVVTFTLAV